MKKKRKPPVKLPPPAPKGNQRAKGNKGGGRKSLFRKHMIGPAKMLAKLGATNAEMAEAFGVTSNAVRGWRENNPVFSATIKDGKDESDNRVVESLFKRATGYSHPDVHISTYEGKPIVTKITKHYPPDATSCIFWLKNRRSNEWKDRSENILQNPDGTALEPITVKVIGGTIPKAKTSNEESQA
jgi:hypothetical protein